MHLRVLGAAAGGGLPQWNCGCRNCADSRAGRIPSMTQSSLAVSADGAAWVLLNASPDLRMQLLGAPSLRPRGLRDTPVAAVVLTNADVDHIAGLLTLREKTAFDLHATPEVLATLAANAVFDVLDAGLVRRCPMALDTPFEPAPGLRITPFAVPGKVALYLEGARPDLGEIGERTVGLMIEDAAARLAYVPGCAALPDWLVERLGGADLLFFDGTVWEDDDMPRTGTGDRTGARMGHVPMQGPAGSLARLAALPARTRKVYIHINNTNPVLQPAGPERALLARAGWEVAHDGMEVTL
ncbi:MAG: pyrroloquinoline quinone biosynthesis protein PqqB [Rhodobacteraceae bacterium]|nr:pyrroloquinoline quinone biosynthesis protein PqqB [Paracoccaceae bacterium]